MVVTTLKYSVNNNYMSAERYQKIEFNARIIFLNYDQLNADQRTICCSISCYMFHVFLVVKGHTWQETLHIRQ